jgi:hypothetical protein
MTKNFFFHKCLSLLFFDPGSGILDRGSGMGKNQDSGSGINIPDPPQYQDSHQSEIWSCFYEKSLNS